MIIVDVEQGSQEWLDIRLGLISASRFKDVLTEPKRKVDKDAGKISQTAASYMCELIGEILTGKGQYISTIATDWGHKNETRALAEYCFEKNITIESKGIIVSDCGFFGASPDGLVAVSTDGMQEVKCPYNPKNHISNVINGMDKQHIPQVQGNLWINGRDWCDFISYDPRITGASRLYVERIYRDEKMINLINSKTLQFAEKLQTVLKNKFGINWDGVNLEDYI